METLVRVTAPHFCAGFVLTDRRVTFAAPILKWTVGKDPAWLSAYFKRKRWKTEVVKARG